MRKKLSVQLEDVPDIVASCCVLHNICQIHGDNFDESWHDPTDVVSITTILTLVCMLTIVMVTISKEL